MSIVVTGSVAFDNIMNFPGHFKDHILPDKVHMLSVAFTVQDLKKQHGGTAANIAYNLALLGERPKVLAAAGEDFTEYREWLQFRGIDTSPMQIIPDRFTAASFITTDMDDNQITGFYPGAMAEAGKISLDTITDHIELVIVSPNAPEAMMRYPQECRDRGVPYFFCPGQQTTDLSDEQVMNGVRGARCVIANDYEMEMIAKRTGTATDDLVNLADIVVTTLGEHGSTIATREGVFEIPSGTARVLNDPTGAGDAYLAGFAHAMLADQSHPRAGRIAALAATYAVEHHGTQQHAYTREEFAARYRATFNEDL